MDGSQFQKNITAINTNTNVFTVSAAVSSGSIANSASVVAAKMLTGSLDNPIVFVPVPKSNLLIFTNGIDPVQTYNGNIIQSLANTPFTSCRFLRMFHGMLLAADVTESGARIPYRIRRSDIGDPTNWTTGVAGFDDLIDTSDFILSLLELGPWMIAYREKTIMRGTYEADINQIIFWEYTVQGTAPISSGMVCQAGSTHIFLATGGIFRYTGGFDLENLGDNIFSFILGVSGNLNPQYQNRAFCFYVNELDEVWFAYPSGGTAFCNRIIRYDMDKESFYPIAPTDVLSGF